MSTEYSDLFGPPNMLSNCCNSISFGELDEYNCGICKKCKDHAEFEKENDDVEEDSKGE